MKKLELKQMENLEGGQNPNSNCKVDREAPGPQDDVRGSGGCSGANVIDCFTDVYSNHGWGSVAASLTTAFIPQTAIAFTLACAAKNGC
ncbi:MULTISPECIES: hypothetical protein [Flavobacterium]|uniref:hypothetical protein n=1 Tax=Flavobacterium TaxID=237 RepID=UPI0021158E73|nr:MULTISPECIES: hypothetical protein [Flavobacterium]UUF15094.1 hypothetical protein NLJ00_03080 [Flavobacterium panici]